MVNLGITYSTKKPQAIEITDKKVYVASDIQECEIEQDFGITISGYKFTLAEYDKDEYIILMAAKASQIDNLQEELEAAKVLLGVD